MKQLEKLVLKLNSDEFAAVTITDNESGKVIVRNMLHRDIVLKHQSAENLFNDLLENGHENLTVQPRRKNGNGFKNDGLEFEITPDEEEEISTKQTEAISLKKKKKKKKNKETSLMGLGMGLNGLQILDINTKASKYEETKADLKEAKEEIKTLRKENDDLKDQVRENKFKVDNTDSRNNMLAGVMQAAPSIITALGLKAAAPGLASPAQESYENLTEVQKNFIETIKVTDDYMLQIFDIILRRTKTPIEGDTFAADFTELLQVHNIIKI